MCVRSAPDAKDFRRRPHSCKRRHTFTSIAKALVKFTHLPGIHSTDIATIYLILAEGGSRSGEKGGDGRPRSTQTDILRPFGGPTHRLLVRFDRLELNRFIKVYLYFKLTDLHYWGHKHSRQQVDFSRVLGSEVTPSHDHSLDSLGST